MSWSENVCWVKISHSHVFLLYNLIFQDSSSTSLDTVRTVLKSPAVLEFEASLKRRKGGDYNLPTPIRELDDMLQANTSTHTSRYLRPHA